MANYKVNYIPTSYENEYNNINNIKQYQNERQYKNNKNQKGGLDNFPF